MWTRFMDMHSGGGAKHQFEYILIEAPRAEATVVFYKRFGTNPERVSCTCCGADYSISAGDDLAQLTAYDRNCDYDDAAQRYVERPHRWSSARPVTPLEEYLKDPEVLVIRSADIKPEERVGDVPRQGYVWMGDDE